MWMDRYMDGLTDSSMLEQQKALYSSAYSRRTVKWEFNQSKRGEHMSTPSVIL